MGVDADERKMRRSPVRRPPRVLAQAPPYCRGSLKNVPLFDCQKWDIEVTSGVPRLVAGGFGRSERGKERDLSHLLKQKWDTGALKSGYISLF